MDITKEELLTIVKAAVEETIKQLGLSGNSKSKPEINEKTAYQKTEQLLYNYNGFKRIINEKMLEIDNLRKYGVPQKSGSVVAYSPHTGTVQGITLQEETVEQAVQNVERSVADTVAALALIDRCMAALKSDPYYPILEMRYFESRTQEDIALELNCTQKTVSVNKNRLVRELSMRLFPNQVMNEMLH